MPTPMIPREIAEEAAVAYADVLENHSEVTPVDTGRFNSNSRIAGNQYQWVQLGSEMTLVEEVFPFKGIREAVWRIIREYRRRARDNRSTRADEGAEDSAAGDIAGAYNGTQPIIAGPRRSSDRPISTFDTYAGASLKPVHDALEKGYGFNLMLEAAMHFGDDVHRLNVEVYGFRIQQKIIQDEWLRPKLVPLNQGGESEFRSQATCRRGVNHRAPNENCMCGFYSVAHPKYLDYYSFKGGHLGVVAKHWGKIIVGRDVPNRSLVHGYRSEWQEVIAVVSFGMSFTNQTALENWGIEVYLGFENMKEWWEQVGARRFDGLVDDKAYGSEGWSRGQW